MVTCRKPKITWVNGATPNRKTVASLPRYCPTKEAHNLKVIQEGELVVESGALHVATTHMLVETDKNVLSSCYYGNECMGVECVYGTSAECIVKRGEPLIYIGTEKRNELMSQARIATVAKHKYFVNGAIYIVDDLKCVKNAS